MDEAERPEHAAPNRRDFMSGVVATGAVSVGLVAGAVHIVKYLVPEAQVRERETFIAYADEVPEGGTLEVVLPTNQRVQIRKLGDEYAGFSTICPHLGCIVYWRSAAPGETDPRKKDGYFRCPCHEGLFGPDGTAFSGPPADAKQALSRVEIARQGNALYVRWQEEVR